jgi:hypothetical protein
MIALLVGADTAMPVPPRGAILITDELLPSHFAALTDAGVAGICTARGGPTAHAAILAASPWHSDAGRRRAGVLDIADGAKCCSMRIAPTLDPAPDPAAAMPAAAKLLDRREPRRRRSRRRAGRLRHGRRHADRDLRQSRLECRRPAAAVARGRGLRPAAHRVPVP